MNFIFNCIGVTNWTEVFLERCGGFGAWGGGGNSQMKLTGMLVGQLELNPKEDQSGRGSGVI